MRLAYVVTGRRGGTDRLLTAFAEGLTARGVALAGVVQSNTERADGYRCDMDLTVLPDGPLIRISQSLGRGARGCRLDSAALEQAVGAVSAVLARAPELMIVNKFGKHEAEGRGFRPLIGEALADGILVLTGLNASNEAAFLDFSAGTAERLADDLDALDAWFADCRAATARA